MAENERDIVYSKSVRAGKRIYYFDVKETRSGEKFLTITESKKLVEGEGERAQFTFQKHKIFLYKEDYEKFVSALNDTIHVAKGGSPDEASEPMLNTPADDSFPKANFDIDLDF